MLGKWGSGFLLKVLQGYADLSIVVLRYGTLCCRRAAWCENKICSTEHPNRPGGAVIPFTHGPVEKCEFVVEGDDSPLLPSWESHRLPGRIGPPQKDEGHFSTVPTWRLAGC